jgi:hypothetical protein
MAFGQPADGRISGHLGDRFKMNGNQAGAKTHGAGCESGFAASVSGPDYDNIIFFQ